MKISYVNSREKDKKTLIFDSSDEFNTFRLGLNEEFKKKDAETR